ncbi:Leucine-rich repeat extensin protein 5 [Spatholobus suberectus]|nr:Leucine-rich repeat extensin protein 5 [Spatholobus suberectus]
MTVSETLILRYKPPKLDIGVYCALVLDNPKIHTVAGIDLSHCDVADAVESDLGGRGGGSGKARRGRGCSNRGGGWTLLGREGVGQIIGQQEMVRISENMRSNL